MEPLNNIFAEDVEYETNELSSETLTGWSSTCLDQTISYYIECNSSISYDDNELKQVTKDLA